MSERRRMETSAGVDDRWRWLVMSGTQPTVGAGGEPKG